MDFASDWNHAVGNSDVIQAETSLNVGLCVASDVLVPGNEESSPGFLISPEMHCAVKVRFRKYQQGPVIAQYLGLLVAKFDGPHGMSSHHPEFLKRMLRAVQTRQ